MKKTIIIMLIVVIILGLVGCFTYFKLKAINENKETEEQALEIVKNYYTLEVTAKNSDVDLDQLKEELQDLDYVKSVTYISKDDIIKSLTESSSLDKEFVDSIPSYFVVSFEITSFEDFKNIKSTIEKIKSIEDVDSVYCELENYIDAYESNGAKGIIEYSQNDDDE